MPSPQAQGNSSGSYHSCSGLDLHALFLSAFASWIISKDSRLRRKHRLWSRLTSCIWPGSSILSSQCECFRIFDLQWAKDSQWRAWEVSSACRSPHTSRQYWRVYGRQKGEKDVQGVVSWLPPRASFDALEDQVVIPPWKLLIINIILLWSFNLCCSVSPNSQ